MEITTSPSRPATTPWGRLLLLVVVVAPVSMLVLLPVGLGLQRYVVTGGSMAGDRPGSIQRGSLVLERLVPVDELRVGDVITFHAPPGSGAQGTVTHRIVDVEVDGLRTQGDAEPEPDPWLLQPADAVVPRVVAAVPVVGYAYLALADRGFWVGVVVVVVAGAVLVAGGGFPRLRGRRLRPSGTARRTPWSRPRHVVPVTAAPAAPLRDRSIGVE